jgi:hypothetical protein
MVLDPAKCAPVTVTFVPPTVEPNVGLSAASVGSEAVLNAGAGVAWTSKFGSTMQLATRATTSETRVKRMK